MLEINQKTFSPSLSLCHSALCKRVGIFRAFQIEAQAELHTSLPRRLQHGKWPFPLLSFSVVCIACNRLFLHACLPALCNLAHLRGLIALKASATATTALVISSVSFPSFLLFDFPLEQ